ncbi:hypothetical protein NLU13_9270 [Sarocladium strictum]|uniref:LPXTG-domain-containing protein n=1 Tax=Sarocladium strictum TaxID=5046 RepID=A0AA39L413_SARSR|nr:hypothetical protein NLU13_9270 [Sarocladium strictum]
MTRSRRSASLALLVSLLLAPAAVRALQFTPGSECAAYCLDGSDGNSFTAKDSNTNTTDIVCHDTDYSTKSRGIKFKNCEECLSKSDHVNGTESDTYWFLYNLRYSLSTCLFGNPREVQDPVNSPCIIDYACLPLEDSLTVGFNSTADDDQGTWAYCDKNKDQFTTAKLQSCVSCLKASTDQSYLANFVVALGAGCDQRPSNGSVVGLTDTVFTTKDINGTAPEEDILARPAGAGSSTLTTGAIVGIAVGAGLLLLSGLGLFCIYWRRQKKYEATEKKGGDFFSSAAGANGSDRAASGGTYTPDPFLPPEGMQMTSSLRHMSGEGGSFGAPPHTKGMSVSSAEYYDQTEIEAQHTNYNFDPRSTNRGPNGALPSHPAYIPRAASRHGLEARSTPPPPPPPSNSNPPSIHNVPPPPAATRNTALAGESYAMHRYTASASSQHGSSSTRSTPKSSPNPPPPPPPPPSQKNKVPALTLPSIGRVCGPKKYSPPLVNRSGTPASMERDRDDVPAERPGTAMHISQPVMTTQDRFQDRPLQGGPVISTQPPPPPERQPRDAQWNEVPMKSGKSALYGY